MSPSDRSDRGRLHGGPGDQASDAQLPQQRTGLLEQLPDVPATGRAGQGAALPAHTVGDHTA